MSLKRNILASYVSQFYVMLVGILIMPLYLKYMGSEAYGLVGFFSMLQVWFNLLDLGLTPTISRETARFQGGSTDMLSFRRLVRALEGIFFVIAILGGSLLFVTSGYIAFSWLKIEHLALYEAKVSIQYMSVIIAFRWMGGLYKGIVSGAEQLVWLGGYNVLIATLRFVGVLVVLIYVSATPRAFFIYQLIVALLEFILLIFKVYEILPKIPKGIRIPWSWVPLKPVLKFSLSIAFTSSVWVLVTQTDKLVLSKILPLAEYGYFTLAVLVANGVTMIGAPIVSAIIPRMAKMEAENNLKGLIAVYRQSTQLTVVIAGAASVTVAFFAEPLLLAWTGDKILAHQAMLVLILYSLGNGLLVVNAFPGYLQYAKGDLKLHLIGNVLFVVFLIPSIIWAASQYGGVGAGYVWLVMNIIYFLIWVPLVHNRFVKGLNIRWFFQDVLVIYAVISIVAYELFLLMPTLVNRWWILIYIAITSLFLLLVGASVSSFALGKYKTSVINKNKESSLNKKNIYAKKSS